MLNQSFVSDLTLLYLFYIQFIKYLYFTTTVHADYSTAKTFLHDKSRIKIESCSCKQKTHLRTKTAVFGGYRIAGLGANGEKWGPEIS